MVKTQSSTKLDLDPSYAEKSPARVHRQVRLADHLLALSACTLLSPVLAIRALIAIFSRGRVFDRREAYGPHGQSFAILIFAGQFPGRHLACLINLLRGQLAWLGPQPSNVANTTSLRPGLFTPNEMRQRIGMEEQGTNTMNAPPSRLKPYLILLARTLLVSLLTGKRHRPAPAHVSLFGVPVSNDNLEDALTWIFARVHSGQKAMVPFVNAHCFNVASTHPEYQQVLRRATRILPDGSGVRLACRFQGFNLKSNLNGTDLFPHLCCEAARQGLPIFLLGAAPGVADCVADKMRVRFPNLQIVGTQHGFFTQDQENEVIEKINRSGARLLLVAMGVPQQELWLASNLDRLNTTVNLGVGGLLDFYAERVSRAPVWLRELGMEWVWRLLQEPRRMWQRYVIGNPLFLLRAWRDSRRHSAQRLINHRGTAPGRRLYWLLCSEANAKGKRLLDILVSASLLVLLSPLLMLTALIIRLESPGAALLIQTRIGRKGTPFAFWKFRSMYQDAEQRKAALLAKNEMTGGVLFKMKQDPRITRVGRFIRRYSIDELPQLWNVLCGDMSLVGPRPALPSEVSQYALTDRQRLYTIPGITCIWQVSGRSSIPFEQQVKMDLDYIHNATLGKNIKLLLKTIPALFNGRGAY